MFFWILLRCCIQSCVYAENNAPVCVHECTVSLFAVLHSLMRLASGLTHLDLNPGEMFPVLPCPSLPFYISSCIICISSCHPARPVFALPSLPPSSQDFSLFITLYHISSTFLISSLPSCHIPANHLLPLFPPLRRICLSSSCFLFAPSWRFHW